MIIIHFISLLALMAMIIYVVCFLFRYRIIPQSLSITAEYNGRYRWWQITICTVMGWLSYWFPTIYAFNDFGPITLLASAGVAGLALAGYYSYCPDEESKRLLIIHKCGSFIGAIFLCLFFLIALQNWYVLTVLGVCAILGLLIKGHRYGFPVDNSIIFWEELGIIGIVGYYIISNFINCL